MEISKMEKPDDIVVETIDDLREKQRLEKLKFEERSIDEAFKERAKQLLEKQGQDYGIKDDYYLYSKCHRADHERLDVYDRAAEIAERLHNRNIDDDSEHSETYETDGKSLFDVIVDIEKYSFNLMDLRESKNLIRENHQYEEEIINQTEIIDKYYAEINQLKSELLKYQDEQLIRQGKVIDKLLDFIG